MDNYNKEDTIRVLKKIFRTIHTHSANDPNWSSCRPHKKKVPNYQNLSFTAFENLVDNGITEDLFNIIKRGKIKISNPLYAEEIKKRIKNTVSCGEPLSIYIFWRGYKKNGRIADFFDHSALGWLENCLFREWDTYPYNLTIIFHDDIVKDVDGINQDWIDRYKTSLKIVCNAVGNYEIINSSDIKKYFKPLITDRLTQEAGQKAEQILNNPLFSGNLKERAKKNADANLLLANKENIDYFLEKSAKTYIIYRYIESKILSQGDIFKKGIFLSFGSEDSLELESQFSELPTVYIVNPVKNEKGGPWLRSVKIDGPVTKETLITEKIAYLFFKNEIFFEIVKPFC